MTQHVVEQGETVATIARKHGVTRESIIQASDNAELFRTRTPRQLFEGDEVADDGFRPGPAGAPVAAPVAAEIYDGAASGLFGGVALGAFVTLLIALAVMILGISGGSEAVLGPIDQNIVYGVAGGSVALMLVFGGIGWMLLRKS